MTPIVRYLIRNELPKDKNEARRLRAKATRFTIHDGKLLKRSFLGPYLRCITPTETSHVLSELHQGECGNHSRGCSLANRAFTAGYYWPTMRSDSTSHVKRCDSCHRFASIVTDNGSQFISFDFQDFCKEWGIKLSFSIPRYPKANG
ncbi:hypothetical protein UlMin_019513 [Ulmus minor]